MIRCILEVLWDEGSKQLEHLCDMEISAFHIEMAAIVLSCLNVFLHTGTARKLL